ncbi:MAG: 2Fe-2S iron-sulfur cluster-binding protein, partial [Caldilineaceae bacterium]
MTSPNTPAPAAPSITGSNTPGAPVRIIFQPNGRQGDMPAGTNLLEAARRMGVEIESICGGHQTCGKCKVVVETGDFAKFGVQSSASALTPAGEREVQYAARFGFAADARLSCACEVLEDVVIRVPEES